jgi:hypothetical protein
MQATYDYGVKEKKKFQCNAFISNKHATHFTAKTVAANMSKNFFSSWFINLYDANHFYKNCRHQMCTVI